MKETTKRPYEEAREMLKTLSQEVSDLVETGTFCTVNDALMETMYKNGIHREFKSYRQWRTEGFTIRTGEKPFLLWAKPKDLEHFNAEENALESGKFFPIVYLFSNAQVESIASTEEEPVHTHPKMELEPLPYS